MGGIVPYCINLCIKGKGNRTIICISDMHMCAKDSTGDGNALFFKQGKRFVVQRFGDLRVRRPVVGGAVAFAEVCQQSELADEKNVTVDLLQIEVHLAVFIPKTADLGNFFADPLQLFFRVPLAHSQIYEQTPFDGADNLAIDSDTRVIDALNDRSHGRPFIR